MRILCLLCTKIFRTRRKIIKVLECPYCHRELINIFEAKPPAYIILDDVKLRT